MIVSRKTYIIGFDLFLANLHISLQTNFKDIKIICIISSNFFEKQNYVSLTKEYKALKKFVFTLDQRNVARGGRAETILVHARLENLILFSSLP